MTLQLKHILEAALLAYHEPLTSQQLIDLFPEHERPAIHEVAAALEELQSDYAERGIELKHVASGYRFQARQEAAPWIKNLWVERPAKYTRAFLETLALIAYRQPITRAEIEEVRGVAVNPNVIKTLMERGWVKVVGHRDVPGRPELLGTTKEFLDYFNVKSLSELPSLQAIQDLEATGSELEVQLQLLQTESDANQRKEDNITLPLSSAEEENVLAESDIQQLNNPVTESDVEQTGHSIDNAVLEDSSKPVL